jgi:hypothetical protein
MPYTTYENARNPHITIHRDGCTQIRRNGGVGEGEYNMHETLADAETYAEASGLPVRKCYFCRP